MIGADDLGVAANWMLGDRPAGDGSRFEEWAKAREVDVEALADFADIEAVDALGNMSAFSPRCVRFVIKTALMQGVATGLEAERRRRDARELPASQSGADS